MRKVIFENIVEAAKASVEAGQAKYREYFIKRPWYAVFKEGVDADLKAAGYADCIATE